MYDNHFDPMRDDFDSARPELQRPLRDVETARPLPPRALRARLLVCAWCHKAAPEGAVYICRDPITGGADGVPITLCRACTSFWFGADNAD